MDTNSYNTNGSQKDTKELLEENQRLLRVILANSEKTRRYVLWGRIMSLIYVLLIIGPIIAAAIYLPPLIGNFVSPYQELLGSPNSKGQVNESLINEVQQFLQEYGN